MSKSKLYVILTIASYLQYAHNTVCTMDQKLAKCRPVLLNACLEHASRTYLASHTRAVVPANIDAVNTKFKPKMQIDFEQ